MYFILDFCSLCILFCRKKNKEKVVPFVIICYPKLKVLSKIIMDCLYFSYMNSEVLKKTFILSPMISFRSFRKIKSYIVSQTLPSRKERLLWLIITLTLTIDVWCIWPPPRNVRNSIIVKITLTLTTDVWCIWPPPRNVRNSIIVELQKTALNISGMTINVLAES